MGAPLSSWPWQKLGSFKYLLYGPLVVQVIQSRAWEGGRTQGVCCLHLLLLVAVRGLIHQLWWSFSSMMFLTRKRRIIDAGNDFKQIDREWDWDDYLIPQAFIGAIAFYLFPSLREIPLWDPKGMFIVLLLHVGVTEPLFYRAHKAFHSAQFFSHYHSAHHASPIPSSFTASHGAPLEHLLMTLLMALPLVGAGCTGTASIGVLYGYILLFDFLRCMGHSNVEVFPSGVFEFFPLLRYLIYTPTYHSLHHTHKNSNYCLFMPLFDALGGTINTKSWALQKEISSGKNIQVPDFVFLAHVVDVVSSLHVPFFLRSFSSMPFRVVPYILVCWPGALLVMLAMWGCSKTFLLSFYNLRGRLHQYWVVPRYGFQYFLPFAKNGILNQIDSAILRADKMGVKVLSLAALNKNEALNGGGTLFVNKHPNLKVRVVHGNTLTAAVILNELPKDVGEVFLTGATSKLGRAIALYLCRKKVRVLMLTLSTERFQKIQKEAPSNCQQYLVQVTKYQAAQNCMTWIVGKWITYGEQRLAPRGAHFHQFVVPPIIGFRRDCTYGKLAAMRLPLDVQGFGMCEYTLDRGVVHACHAGGVVHCLEGWTHHEVGAIDVDRVDVVWKAALKQGLSPI